MTQAMPKQYYFVSNRNVVISSILGYAIEFKKGEPTHVPRRMHATVMEKGIVPCDIRGAALDVADIEATPEAKVLLAPEEAEDRAPAIRGVIDAIVKRNSSNDFSAGGVPSASAVTAALGWKVDAKEIRPIWDKVKQERAIKE
jgi:hypothetical protein